MSDEVKLEGHLILVTVLFLHMQWKNIFKLSCWKIVGPCQLLLFISPCLMGLCFPSHQPSETEPVSAN